MNPADTVRTSRVRRSGVFTLRSRRASTRAVTLVELLVAAVASAILLGSLVVTSIQLKATSQATERYSKSQADQIRLIDYLARDLRMAVSVGVNAVDSPLLASGRTTMTISTTDSLVIQVSDYYKDNDPANFADYKTQKPLYSYRTGIAYGDGSDVQGYSTVTYSKVARNGGSFNYVRTEDGVAQVIAIDSRDLMDVDVSLSTGGVSAAASNRVFVLESFFLARFRWPPWENDGRARVTSSDRIMLRNPRIDL